MTTKQSIAWLQAAWKDDKKRINLLLVSGLAGMLLLCMSEWLPAGQSTQNAAQSSQQSQTAAEYEQQLETRLAAVTGRRDSAHASLKDHLCSGYPDRENQRGHPQQRRQPAHPSAGRCTAGGAVGSGTAGARRGRALPRRG